MEPNIHVKGHTTLIIKKESYITLYFVFSKSMVLNLCEPAAM